ncbi:MAG TPA: hypothetical protein VH164_05155, partial [Ktedonobacteraceae bacterium]|nr:hypothetical protein [Ktedonobacteraceae bacterium]
MTKRTVPPSPWIVACSIRVYRWLLWLGPAEFCREYAPSILQSFRSLCQDTYHHHGAWGVLRLWLPLSGDVVGGMLAEHLSALQHPPVRDERRRHMLRTQRRSIIMIFLAFVLFGLPWLLFQGVIDPLSQWNPIAQAHPEVDILYRVVRTAGEIAFLMMLGTLLPILFVAVKQALASLRRDILTLIGLSAIMTLVFMVVTLLVITGYWTKSFDPNGGIYAVFGFLFVGTVTITLSLAVARSDLSERVLRLALWPAIIMTAAMLI